MNLANGLDVTGFLYGSTNAFFLMVIAFEVYCSTALPTPSHGDRVRKVKYIRTRLFACFSFVCALFFFSLFNSTFLYPNMHTKLAIAAALSSIAAAQSWADYEYLYTRDALPEAYGYDMDDYGIGGLWEREIMLSARDAFALAEALAEAEAEAEAFPKGGRKGGKGGKGRGKGKKGKSGGGGMGSSTPPDVSSGSSSDGGNGLQRRDAEAEAKSGMGAYDEISSMGMRGGRDGGIRDGRSGYGNFEHRPGHIAPGLIGRLERMGGVGLEPREAEAEPEPRGGKGGKRGRKRKGMKHGMGGMGGMMGGMGGGGGASTPPPDGDSSGAPSPAAGDAPPSRRDLEDPDVFYW